MTTIRVAIGDDDEQFRSALTDVLLADGRFDVVGDAATGHGLVAVVAETDPDLVLLDVRMPAGGVVAARAITSLERTVRGRPRPVVVALTAESSAVTVVAMLRAGAVGYLVKGRVGANLPDLLARVFAGGVVLAAPSAMQALRQLVGPLLGGE